MLYYIMNSVTEFVDKEMVSIFRNTPDIPSIYGGGILSTRMRPLLPLFIAILIWAAIGYMMYVYQQKIRHFIGSWLLYFHMGKNNEIYTIQTLSNFVLQSFLELLPLRVRSSSQIPENNHFQSLLSTIDFSEELRPF